MLFRSAFFTWLRAEQPMYWHAPTAQTPDGEGFTDLALLVYDQAKLAESGSVADPGEFVRRLNRLLGQLMTLAG